MVINRFKDFFTSRGLLGFLKDKLGPDDIFEYGHCNTSMKKNYRSELMMSAENRGFLYDTLKELGLPKPLMSDTFFGTGHDIFFLNSHGVVIRVGLDFFSNLSDLANPFITQPVFAIKDDNSNFIISIYAGIELLEDHIDEIDNPLLDLACLVDGFGNVAGDIKIPNSGVMRVKDQYGEEVKVVVHLDPDCHFNAVATSRNKSQSHYGRVNQKAQKPKPKKEMVFDEFGHLDPSKLKACLDERYKLFEASDYVKNVSAYKTNGKSYSALEMVEMSKQIFDYHQPVRRAFEKAFDKDGKVIPSKMKKAWEMVKNYHDRGHGIYKKPDEHSYKHDCVQLRKLHSPWKHER